MKFKESVTYDDLLLVPQYSDIQSRSEVGITSFLGHHELTLPIMASPMDTVSELSMAQAMSEAGGMAVIHRYNTIEEQQSIAAQFFSNSGWKGTMAAAIGVTGDYLERTEALIAAGTNVVCIDVAHGHHILVKKALEALRNEYGKDMVDTVPT